MVEFLRSDKFIASAAFALALAIFLLSPVTQMADSKYSLLVSEALISRQTFMLDGFDVGVDTSDLHFLGPPEYHLQNIGGHVYYAFPPGSSVLSTPFVAIADLVGGSVAPAGIYSAFRETLLQRLLAAILMAALTLVVFLTARLLLPRPMSLLITCAMALGTQVWSTASRGLWSDTWGVLLLSLAVWMILASEVGKRSLSPVLLGTLLAWMYFCKPTYSIPIIGITIFVSLLDRRQALSLLTTGAVWLGAFVSYSWYNFHQFLPDYYHVYWNITWDSFEMALVGNLISPSRGLLVFVPTVLFIGYLLIKYWDRIASKRLVLITVAVIVAHLLVVSTFQPWYGGHCYGPRYSTGIMPLFCLLGVSGTSAWRSTWNGRSAHKIEVISGSVLLVLAVLINGVGGIDKASWSWNSLPLNVDEHPERVWDWRDAQFLVKYNRWRRLPDQ